MHGNDTIVALATPPGIGAIGMIRLSGPDAIDICNSVFSGKDLSSVDSHTIHFGKIMKGEEAIDEVLVSVFKWPNSYTGEHVVEVSCHGSPYIHSQMIRLFIDQKARTAAPGEFTMRAFLNGKMDLSQAEAVADLIAASSESAHRLAMNQMRGGYSSELQTLREELLHFASMVELELDFGEEDVEFANKDKLNELVTKIQDVISKLIRSFELGNVLKNGVATVIAGKPNAGKSTLLNALLNEDRAIVSEIPGTTRDTIEEMINIDGILFRLIDTAGLREATDAIEEMGVGKAKEKLSTSAVVLYVFDVNEGIGNELDELGLDGAEVIVVANKIDLGEVKSQESKGKSQEYVDEEVKRQESKGKSQEYVESEDEPQTSNLKPQTPNPKPQTIEVSAKQGTGLDALKHAMVKAVVDDPSLLESTVVSNARHMESLGHAAESLADVTVGIEESRSGELLALDIRRALDYIGEITGEVTTEDLLGNIFGKFCIGK